MENVENLKYDLLYSINHNESIVQIMNKYRSFLKAVLNRDLRNIDQKTRDRIETCTVAYIYKMIEKGYLTPNNIYECLKRFVYGTSHFKNESRYPYIYARFNIDQIEINFKSERAINLLEHFLYHEYTHCLCSPITKSQNLGKYKPKQISSHNLNIISRNDDYETIINEGFIQTFLNELCAESTACDLLEDYQEPRILDSTGTKSNWVTEFNRHYQEPGYEFLKTIFTNSNNQNDRDLFKKLTIKAMNGDCDLGREIQEVYEKKNPIEWKDDLHTITTNLCSLINNFNNHRDQINRSIELMQKYKSNFIIIERTDTPEISGFRKK